MPPLEAGWIVGKGEGNTSEHYQANQKEKEKDGGQEDIYEDVPGSGMVKETRSSVVAKEEVGALIHRHSFFCHMPHVYQAKDAQEEIAS